MKPGDERGKFLLELAVLLIQPDVVRLGCGKVRFGIGQVCLLKSAERLTRFYLIVKFYKIDHTKYSRHSVIGHVR